VNKKSSNIIKHFSFDLWLTLIKSNPLFKIRRAHFFYTKFNRLHKSIEEIRNIFQEADILFNAINEKTGGNITAEEMYLMVIIRINESTEIIKDLDLHLLYADLEKLVFEYMPEVFCDKTLKVLEHLKCRKGVTLNILSNTGFIKGSTLRKINREIGISKYFDFEIYSDEVGLSKPNSKIYADLIEKITMCRQDKVTNKEIMHIGDNYYADILGAQKAGIHSFQVNSINQSIIHLLD
jgi:putative hydrolase of the HAD superfamily